MKVRTIKVVFIVCLDARGLICALEVSLTSTQQGLLLWVNGTLFLVHPYIGKA
jgi:hypothetical protein